MRPAQGDIMPGPSGIKRLKELKRQDRKQDKEQRKEERRRSRAQERSQAPEGADPDIAHIVPGPQAPLE